MEKSVLTAKEVADYLKLGVDSVYRLANSGQIPAFKVLNKWRFNEEEILAFTRNISNGKNISGLN